MYAINYWTNEWYKKNVWDVYICKSFASMRKKLKELINYLYKDNQDDILKQYDTRVFNKKTMFSCWWLNISLESEWLYINISSIEVF